MAIAATIALFVWPALVGIGFAFRQSLADRISLGFVMAMLPTAIILLGAPMLLRSALPQLSDLFIILAISLLTSLVFYTCLRVAKPFAETWHEHKQKQVEETFK